MSPSFTESPQLPESLASVIAARLREAGDPTPLRRAEVVAGGYASAARRLVTDRAAYLLKWHERPLPGAFPSEARGLALLGEVGGVRVPDVLAAADPQEKCPGFLLLEWIDARPADAYWNLGARYGERIARFHRASAARGALGYGLDHDNYVGKSSQSNAWTEDWVAFFRDRRLRPQVELAARLNLLPADCFRRLEALLGRLEKWLGGVERRPVLLHGDLWRGNVLFDAEGEPVLIDPAVCWGDREFDLATVRIYEAAPSGFDEAYQSVWPTSSGFAERCDLHNLYLCLCCLTEDGDRSFIPRIVATLHRYLR